MIRALTVGLVAVLMVAVGATLLAQVTVGPSWDTPIELVAGFLLCVAGGVGMTWAVGA